MLTPVWDNGTTVPITTTDLSGSQGLIGSFFIEGRPTMPGVLNAKQTGGAYRTAKLTADPITVLLAAERPCTEPTH